MKYSKHGSSEEDSGVSSPPIDPARIGPRRARRLGLVASGEENPLSTEAAPAESSQSQEIGSDREFEAAQHSKVELQNDVPIEADRSVDSRESSDEPVVEDSELESELRAPRKNRRRALIAGGVAILLAVSGGGYYIYANSTVVPKAPGIHSQSDSLDVCEDFLEDFEKCTVKFEPNDSEARDNLVSQSVEPGYAFGAPEQIELTYSSGPKEAEFPDVLRRSYDEVSKELYGLGFNVGEVKTVDKDDLEPNRIVSSSVESGEIVPNGTKIDLEISSEMVTLPDLSGLTKEQAETDLAKLEFRVKIQEETSEQAPGTIVSQEPAAGKVSKGAEITLKIAKAEEVKLIPIPSVVGKTEAEAQSLIAAAGFRNIAVVKVESSKVTDEKVAYVVPGENRTVNSDSNVVLIVLTPESS